MKRQAEDLFQMGDPDFATKLSQPKVYSSAVE
jgi:hypothetical protein